MNEKEPKNLGDIERLTVQIVNISQIIESVEKMLKEKGKIPYDLEGINVSTSNKSGTEKTMGDLHRERNRMQKELENKLVNHKTVPYVVSDHEEFITKMAASVLDNPYVLETRLRTEFDSKVGDMLKRYRELSLFFVKKKPCRLVVNRLKEALECYVYGFFQGCAILCRSTLETALREKIKEKLGKEPNKRKSLGPIIDDAMKLGILSRKDEELANNVKSIGDDSVHDSRRCSSSEAFESLTKTKLLLNIFYR
jgi:hypothetical protein